MSGQGAHATLDPAVAGGGEDAALALHPEDAAQREARARRARLRLVLALAVLASAAALVGIGTWTYEAVERSLRELRAATLTSMLQVQAKTIEVWIEDQKLGTQRLARDRQVQEGVRALAELATRPGAALEHYCSAPARRPLVDQLDEALAGSGAVTFNVIDRSGLIVASKFPEYCGFRVGRAMREQVLGAVFDGRTLFMRPYGEADRLEQPPPRLPLAQPLVWVETPVLDAAGQVVAALGVGHYAHEQLATILAAGRGGETTEVYAFDVSGLMLSESRFTPVLAERGLIPQGGRTALSLLLRPPGAADDRLTRLAASARAGVPSGLLDAVLVEPYPGYYGEEVIGAWRWLPAHDMGIAVEISAAEAYAPLVVLRTAFGVVFGALVVAVIAALYAWFSAAVLRSQSGERRRLGPYLLEKRIGEGGVANVYLARHDLLKRPTAVKLLKPTRSTDEMVARFKREAQLASQLSHPNMVEIFDYGFAPDGTLYYAMEYLEGETIGELVLRRGAMPVARAVHLLRQVCAGLAEAHGKGLVHRDISATNIMVCRYGGEYDFAKILDFGLVKNFSQPHSQTITRTLRILGTPLYMAPERLRSPADVDARADIYAVGAIAFFVLSGRRMFEAEDELALTSKVLNEVPPRLAEVAAQPIPEALARLVAACLEKRREDRPQSIAELLEVLDALARTLRWTPRDAEAAWRADRARPAGTEFLAADQVPGEAPRASSPDAATR